MPAIVMPAVYRTLHCAILTTPSLYIVGSIAFGRRGATALAIVATFPPSELL